MSSAHRYLTHYTANDYQQWEGDWELWQGIAVSMSPSPFGRHQKVAMRLSSLLLACCDVTQCEAVVLCEIDWIVSEHTVVRPDVLVLCGDAPSRHVQQVPAIIAEVISPSTEQRDRTEKFELYESQGVQYYLILNSEQNTLDAYSLDQSEKYQSMDLGEIVSLEICGDCRLQFPIAKLFV